MQQTIYSAILQHLQEKGGQEHQKYHLDGQPHTSLGATEIVRSDVCLRGCRSEQRPKATAISTAYSMVEVWMKYI